MSPGPFVVNILIGRYLRNITRSRWEARGVIRPDVGAANFLDTPRLVTALPVCPNLVKPGMMEVEERVSGAGNSVLHLGVHQPKDTAVPTSNSPGLQHPRALRCEVPLRCSSKLWRS